MPPSSSKIAGSISGFLAEGDIHSKRGDWARASESYTKAIKLDPVNKAALIGRTRCYIALGQPEAAIKDVDKILEKDKFFYKGIFQKAEALFSAGNFEHALIYYHRGLKLRADLDDFRLGIQKCQEAIDLALSSDRKPEAARRHAALMASQGGGGSSGAGLEASMYGGPASPGPGESGLVSSRRPGSTLPPVHAMEPDTDVFGPGERTARHARPTAVLGELSADRKFLEDLVKDDSLKSRNMTVAEIAHDGLKYLDTRTEFWRQQNPGGVEPGRASRGGPRSGSRGGGRGEGGAAGLGGAGGGGSGGLGDTTARESASRGYQDRGQANANASKPSTKTPKTIAKQRYLENTRFAMQKLEAIAYEMGKEDWASALKMQKAFLSRLSTMELADKGRILGTLYDQMGTAYLHLDKLNLAIIHFHKDLDISIKEKFKDAFLRALGNLGNVYQRMGDTDQAATMWEKKLIALDTADEEAELCESIARCYFTSQRFDLAIEFGERGIKSAQLRGDVARESSVTFIVGHAHFNNAQYDKAIQKYEKYLELARQNNDDLARADALSSLGNAYLQLGEVSKSVALQQEAILISSSLNQPYQANPADARGAKGSSQQQQQARSGHQAGVQPQPQPPRDPAENPRPASRTSSLRSGGRPTSARPDSRPRSALTRSDGASPDLVDRQDDDY